jgi:hypothetical protein
MPPQETTGSRTFQVKVGPVENPVTLEVHPAPGDIKHSIRISPDWKRRRRFREESGLEGGS